MVGVSKEREADFVMVVPGVRSIEGGRPFIMALLGIRSGYRVITDDRGDSKLSQQLEGTAILAHIEGGRVKSEDPILVPAENLWRGLDHKPTGLRFPPLRKIKLAPATLAQHPWIFDEDGKGVSREATVAKLKGLGTGYSAHRNSDQWGLRLEQGFECINQGATEGVLNPPFSSGFDSPNLDAAL